MKIKDILESATVGATSSANVTVSPISKKPKKGQKLNLLGFPVEGQKSTNVIKRNMS